MAEHGGQHFKGDHIFIFCRRIRLQPRRTPQDLHTSAFLTLELAARALKTRVLGVHTQSLELLARKRVTVTDAQHV